MEEIKVNLENLTEEERKLLMDLVKKGNEKKLKIEYPIGKRYYYINEQGEICLGVFSITCYWDMYRYEHGNFFLTDEEAKFEQEKQKVLFELKYWSGGYKFIKNAKNYYICWDIDMPKFIKITSCSYEKHLNNIYFKSEKDILNAIKQVGVYRIKKYLFEIED